MEVMPTSRPHGTVTRLAREHAVSRQTIYTISAIGRDILVQNMEPKPHGPQVEKKVVQVNRDRLARSAVVLTWVGVSQRDIGRCCEALLDTSRYRPCRCICFSLGASRPSLHRSHDKPSNHET